MKIAIELITEERERQVSKEGWTAEHDDTHTDRELARAAGAYIQHYYERAWVIENELGLNIRDGLAVYRRDEAPDCFPEDWAWNPKDKLPDLIRAGALIAAEIDRLLRIQAATEGSQSTITT